MSTFKTLSKVFGLLFAITSLLSEIILLFCSVGIIRTEFSFIFHCFIPHVLAQIFLIVFFIFNIYAQELKEYNKLGNIVSIIYASFFLVRIFVFMYNLYIDKEMLFFFQNKSRHFFELSIFLLIGALSKFTIIKPQKVLYKAELILASFFTIISLITLELLQPSDMLVMFNLYIFISLIISVIFILDILASEKKKVQINKQNSMINNLNRS